MDGIEIKDHLEKGSKDECGYCGQLFGPDDIVIEKTIHGREWCFCSEQCYRDFLDASDFKDDEFDKEKKAGDFEAVTGYDEPKGEDADDGLSDDEF